MLSTDLSGNIKRPEIDAEMDDISTSPISSPAKSSEKLLRTTLTGNAEYGYPSIESADNKDDDEPSSAGSDTEELHNGCSSSSTSESGNEKRGGSDRSDGCLHGCLDRLRSLCCCGGDGVLSSFDCYWPRRYTVVLLQFIGMCIVNSQRVNVGIAVVAVLDAETAIHSKASPGAQAANDQVSTRLH